MNLPVLPAGLHGFRRDVWKSDDIQIAILSGYILISHSLHLYRIISSFVKESYAHFAIRMPTGK